MPPPETFNVSATIPVHFSGPLTPPPPNTVHLAAGLVFSQQGHSTTPIALRVLLLKRAPSIRYPLDNKWDFPGGGVEFGPSSESDAEAVGADKSIVHAAVREVYEETGLTVTTVQAYIGSDSWTTADGKRVEKFCFLVEVAELEDTVTGNEWEIVPVKLMDDEHTEYAWEIEGQVPGYEFNSSQQMQTVRKAFKTWLRDVDRRTETERNLR